VCEGGEEAELLPLVEEHRQKLQDALRESIERRRTTVDVYRQTARELSELRRKVRVSHVAGHSAGLLGAVLTAGVALAAVATGGAALAAAGTLTLMGTATGVTGAAVLAGSSLAEIIVGKQRMRRLEAVTEEDQRAVDRLALVALEANKQITEATKGVVKRGGALVAGVINLVSTISAQGSLATGLEIGGGVTSALSSSAAAAGSSVSDDVVAASGRLLAKNVLQTGIKVALVPWEAYNLFLATVELNKAEPSQAEHAILHIAGNLDMQLYRWEVALAGRDVQIMSRFHGDTVRLA